MIWREYTIHPKNGTPWQVDHHVYHGNKRSLADAVGKTFPEGTVYSLREQKTGVTTKSTSEILASYLNIKPETFSRFKHFVRNSSESRRQRFSSFLIHIYDQHRHFQSVSYGINCFAIHASLLFPNDRAALIPICRLCFLLPVLQSPLRGY